ncbi:MAG TPA: hypothetical protein VGQ81_10260 [Acidobacteriota bacterium]|nr:hypothetical protein [Acidobacteriota bacterium]
MTSKTQVGIKELKDRASAVVDRVVRSGRPVTHIGQKATQSVYGRGIRRSDLIMREFTRAPL